MEALSVNDHKSEALNYWNVNTLSISVDFNADCWTELDVRLKPECAGAVTQPSAILSGEDESAEISCNVAEWSGATVQHLQPARQPPVWPLCPEYSREEFEVYNWTAGTRNNSANTGCSVRTQNLSALGFS